MVQFGNFLGKKRIMRELRAQPLQSLARFRGVLMAQIVKRQQDTGKGQQIPAMVRNQCQLFHALFLIAFQSSPRRSIQRTGVGLATDKCICPFL